jgi:hypothetical protein
MKIKYFFIGFLGAVLYLTSCEAPKMLYSWNNYDETSYKYLKNSDEKSTEQLITTYRNLIEKQTGTRKTVPPGIYADYGFILLQAGKTEEGKAMLEKEFALYPESKVFIGRILKMFDK